MEPVKFFNKISKKVIIGFPFSVVIATIVGTPHTLSDSILYYKVLLNLTIGVVGWMILYWTSRLFDIWLPWQTSNYIKRWFLQMAFGVPIVLFIVWCFILVRNDILNQGVSGHIFVFTDIPIITFISFFILRVYQQKLETQMEPSKNQPLTIRNSNKTHVISPEEIAYVFRVGDNNYLRRWDGQDILLDRPIREIESALGDVHFFRVNRKLLVNRHAISSYKIRPDRRTLLEIKPTLNDEFFLNKNRLSLFKQWIQA